MDLNEKKKSDVFRWLVSMSQYKTGLFGLGKVIHILVCYCTSSCEYQPAET